MDLETVYLMMDKEPQTYHTILGELYTNETSIRCLRRKLNRDFKQGLVYKTMMPNSLSRVIFYPLKRKYIMFFTECNLVWNVYYCFQYKEEGTRIHMKTCGVLKDTYWEKLNNITIHKEDLLKVI